MAPLPVVTGLSPKEGAPGTKVIIRGEYLGYRANDLIGLTICGSDCLLSAEWTSPNKIIARTGPAKGKGEIIVTTASGGVGSCTVEFRAFHESIGPMKESAVWIEETPMQSLQWGRRALAPTGYTQEDPLGLSIEDNEKKLTEDLRDLFPDSCGDLSQENFSPGWFLLENHSSTSFEDLKAGLTYLRRKVNTQRDGQLSFLKANAGSVMDQLDTLMMLRDKYDEDVKEFGNHPIKLLEAALKESISESNSLFTEVLSRRDKADSTRAALLAMLRHRFLFCLPNSVERNAKKEQYDIVVNDYARAKNLFGKTDVAIFRKVLDEVDFRIVEIRKELHVKVCRMPQTVEQQKKFVKALISLENQQIGAAAAQHLNHDDPTWDAIEARAKYLEDTLKTTFDQTIIKDQQANSSKLRDPNTPPNRVQFAEEICEIVADQLPNLWRLGQAYFTKELGGVSETSPENFKRIILNSIDFFCGYIRSAILSLAGHKSLFSITTAALSSTKTPAWPSSNHSGLTQIIPWLPQCLRFLRISYATLIRLDLPSEVLDMVQKLIDQMRLFCLSTIFKKTLEKVRALEEKETWTLGVTDYAGATLLPSNFEAILVETLEEGQQTCLTPEIRESSILEAQSDGQKEITRLVQEILDTFCSVIENLAFQRCDDVQHGLGVSQLIGFPNSPHQNNSVMGSPGGVTNAAVGSSANAIHEHSDVDTIVTWEERLLCCMANCEYSNRIFFPHLGVVFEKFGYPIPRMAIEKGKTAAIKLFNTLRDTYVEHKSDPLVGTIEPSMYIGRFQWEMVNTSGQLRPYAHECLDNLVSVYSEIYTISPSLLRPILEPIIQTVAEELARLMSCVQKFSNYGAFQANIDIQLIRDALRLYSNSKAKLFFDEALYVIPRLSEIGGKELSDALSNIKDSMKLQLLCFSVEHPAK